MISAKSAFDNFIGSLCCVNNRNIFVMAPSIKLAQEIILSLYSKYKDDLVIKLNDVEGVITIGSGFFSAGKLESLKFDVYHNGRCIDVASNSRISNIYLNVKKDDVSFVFLNPNLASKKITELAENEVDRSILVLFDPQNKASTRLMDYPGAHGVIHHYGFRDVPYDYNEV